MLIITIMLKFRSDFRRSDMSKVPTANPMPLIGPISGEMSMAPMMTAVELTFNPTEAMIMAKTESKC